MEEKEKNEKTKRLLRKKIAVLVVIFIMMLCLLTIAVLLVFQIRKVKVEGNAYLTVEEIQEWLQEDDLSMNSLYLMYKTHFTNFELLPTMESASVKMVNPWTIKVNVEEKKAVGYIEMGDECVYFDEDGRVLAKTRELWEDVPKVDGIQINDVTLYEELPVSDGNKKAFKNLLEISTTLTKYELVPTCLEVVGSEVYLYFGNQCVILGDENIENRIAQIKPILEKLGEQKGTLHLENYDSDHTLISFEKDILPSDGQNGE